LILFKKGENMFSCYGHIRKKDEELERKIKEAQERLSKVLRE